jgi:UDP-2,3-diacylglucosamine pyrophosphatase LpxH
MKSKKREVEVVVISDIHLGTYGCHARELLMYLKSIKPKKLVLNGDIVDFWQFSKNYWPKPHMQIIKHIMGMVAKGTKVYYITGNHDEMMRKFKGFKLGSFSIANKLVLKLDGKRAWIFHGDVFDVTMQHSRWLAQMGAIGYDMLILFNRGVNFINITIGRKPISLSRKIKNGVKSAVKYINNFEKIAAEIAIMKRYDYVVCGHIHQPEVKVITTNEGEVLYLNSGDWVENLTSLEYDNGEWNIYNFNEDSIAQSIVLKEDNHAYLDPSQLFVNMQKEFRL